MIQSWDMYARMCTNHARAFFYLHMMTAENRQSQKSQMSYERY